MLYFQFVTILAVCATVLVATPLDKIKDETLLQSSETSEESKSAEVNDETSLKDTGAAETRVPTPTQSLTLNHKFPEASETKPNLLTNVVQSSPSIPYSYNNIVNHDSFAPMHTTNHDNSLLRHQPQIPKPFNSYSPGYHYNYKPPPYSFFPQHDKFNNYLPVRSHIPFYPQPSNINPSFKQHSINFAPIQGSFSTQQYNPIKYHAPVQSSYFPPNYKGFHHAPVASQYGFKPEHAPATVTKVTYTYPADEAPNLTPELDETESIADHVAARVSYTPLSLPMAVLAHLYLTISHTTDNMMQILSNFFTGSPMSDS